MIDKISREYTLEELHIFAEASPERYESLCRIVGEIAIEMRYLNVSIALPYEGDEGCVVAWKVTDSGTHVVQARYF